MKSDKKNQPHGLCAQLLTFGFLSHWSLFHPTSYWRDAYTLYAWPVCNVIGYSKQMIHRRLWCMHNAWQLNLYQFCKKKGEKIENPWSENESADSLTCRNCIQRDNDRGFLVQNQDVQQDGQSDRYFQQDAGILLVSQARWGRQECELDWLPTR